MSFKGSVPFTLDLIPSRVLLLGNSCCHLLALISLSVLAVPAAIKLFIGLALGLSLIVTQACYGCWRNRWFINQVHWSADGSWVLYSPQGTGRSARLRGIYVHPWVVILHFALDGLARRAVVILPDSADPDEIRRLRVRLLAYHRR